MNRDRDFVLPAGLAVIALSLAIAVIVTVPIIAGWPR